MSLDHHDLFLLTTALGAVIALVVLIARFKINPFVVLLSVSLLLAIVTGMPAASIAKSFEAGLGGTLGHIAIVVALGTMLGKMMAESGGSDRIAHTLIDFFGEKRAPWAMVLIGLLVGLPVFFEVAFVLLIPIAFNVARRTGTSILWIGLPMVAGMSVVHGLVPPHPAAMLAVSAFNADIGRTVFYALLVGIPTAIIAGPLYAKFIAPRIQLSPDNPMAEQFLDNKVHRNMPSFGLTVSTILLPVVLILIGGWADKLSAPGTGVNTTLRVLGGADVALLIGAVVSFVTLGGMRGFSRETILKFSNDSLAPTAMVTLLVGAGGGFGRILQDSGTSQAIIHAATGAHVSTLLLAWLLAAVVRLATGSATVGMSTSAAIVAPIALQTATVRPELLVLAAGAGSLFFSHVNDGGFWLVKEYFNMTVMQTIKSWSICETIISVVALLLTLGLSLIV